MTDHIPNHRPDRSRAMDEAIQLRDMQEKLRVAQPIDTGRDILRTHLGDLTL